MLHYHVDGTPLDGFRRRCLSVFLNQKRYRIAYWSGSITRYFLDSNLVHKVVSENWCSK